MNPPILGNPNEILTEPKGGGISQSVQGSARNPTDSMSMNSVFLVHLLIVTKVKMNLPFLINPLVKLLEQIFNHSQFHSIFLSLHVESITTIT